MVGKVAILAQGPIYADSNDSSTASVLRALQALEFRNRFYVICALWEDEPLELVKEIAGYADKVVICPKPALPGTGNRNYQKQGVSNALEAVASLNIQYVLKTRTDILLSEKFLRLILRRADSGFKKVLVTNVFTRYESFHISDLVLFSTYDNIKAWFDPREVYYEDLYSSEVQFSRVFIRNKKLNYTMRLENYLAFLRDWIEVVDWHEQELQWLKPTKEGYSLGVRTLGELSTALGDSDFGPLLGKLIGPKPRRNLNKLRNLLTRTNFFILYDRDTGPIASRTISAQFYRFISVTRIPLPMIAAVLATSDLVLSFIVRYSPLFRGRWSYYTVDPKVNEHEKPIA